MESLHNTYTIENNFGIKGGVVYTSNDGYIKFRSSKIRWNLSLYSSILVTLSSPTSYTEFIDTIIYNNTLLALTDFIDNKTYKVNLRIPELSYLKSDFLIPLPSRLLSRYRQYQQFEARQRLQI